MTDLHLVKFDQSNMSVFGTLEADSLTPLFQADFANGLNIQRWQRYYIFTVTDPATDPVAGDIYSNSNSLFTVVYNSTTTLVCSGYANPAASGNLVRVSGAGTDPIIYSAFTVRIGTVFGTGAEVDTDSGRLRIQSGTSATSYAYIRSRRAIRYRAGQGNTVRITPIFAAAVTNNLQAWGVGSIASNAIYDGYFFGTDPTSGVIGIWHYIAGSGTFTARTAWNGDKIDGSAGTSFTWDITKGNPMMIKYPYLGYGDIQFFAQVPTTGRWTLCHTIRYGNTSATTQLSNPSLYFIGININSGNTTNKIMYLGSVGVFLSGARSFVSNPKWAADNLKATITTETAIMNLQNVLTYNTKENRGQMRLTVISISADNATGTTIVRLKVGATIGGTPSWAAIDGTVGSASTGIAVTSGNSIVTKDVAGTTVTGGITIHSTTVNNPGTSVINLTEENLFIGAGETLTISGYSSASASITVTMNWTEDI